MMWCRSRAGNGGPTEELTEGISPGAGWTFECDEPQQQHLQASLAVRQISQIADVAARNVTTIVHMTR
jgi:hypothetical protein